MYRKRLYKCNDNISYFKKNNQYTSLCVIKIGAEVVTLLIIYQIRSCLGGSEGNVGGFEEHKQ